MQCIQEHDDGSPEYSQLLGLLMQAQVARIADEALAGMCYMQSQQQTAPGTSDHQVCTAVAVHTNRRDTHMRPGKNSKDS